MSNNKRLLHDIFHIGPGISPRLPYQARQRSWSADTRDAMENFMSQSIYHIFYIDFFQALSFILQKRSLNMATMTRLNFNIGPYGKNV